MESILNVRKLIDLMERKRSCPLCNFNKVKTVEFISPKDVINLYYNSFGIDISNEFKNITKITYSKCKNCGLYFFNSELAGSPTFYEDLQNNGENYYTSNRKEFTFAIKYIQKNDNVLEIGSGSGYFGEKLNVRSYLGLEFNDKAIKESQLKGLQVINKTIEDYSKTENKIFDVICSFHVIEHVKDPYGFINSSIKLLKKGGRLIIAVPSIIQYYLTMLITF